MALLYTGHNLLSVCVSPRSAKPHKLQTLICLTPSNFPSPNSISTLKSPTCPSIIKTRSYPTPKRRRFPVVFAAQSNFLKVLQTVWKVGKDGIEAGTNLVPDPVPRPVARISVTVVALAVSLFVLKSFLSTAFFVLGTMGLIYFIFLALNKDDGPKSGGGTSTGPTSVDDSLEEARRIMEKYK